MNPTPTFTQLTAEPNAQSCWWLFPALFGIVLLVWYVQRWLNQKAIKAALDATKAAADAEKQRIDDAMFGHLPPDASEYRRARMALNMACVQYERPDLIVTKASNAKTPKSEVNA